jgi:hypothetical protein
MPGSQALGERPSLLGILVSDCCTLANLEAERPGNVPGEIDEEVSGSELQTLCHLQNVETLEQAEGLLVHRLVKIANCSDKVQRAVGDKKE